MRFEVKNGVFLDKFREKDIGTIVWAMNNKEITKTLAGPPRDPYYEQDAWDFYKMTQENLCENGLHKSWCLRNAEQELIGGIDIRPNANGDVASFGFWLSPQYWGKSLMTDALSIMVHRVGVEQLGLYKFEGDSCRGNWGSRKVFEKNGFQFVGEQLQGGKKLATGELIDLWLFRLDLK